MRVFIVVPEFPYPANHGGRVDMWNKILAFKKYGAELFLIAWYKVSDEPSQHDINEVKAVVHQLVTFPYPGKLKRLVNMLRYPSLVAARIPDEAVYQDLLRQARSFSPDFVFIDTIFGGKTGLSIARDLGIPVSLRLHNIEHLYLYGQFKLAKKLYPKLQLLATLVHLKKFERNLIANVDHFFDISAADLEFWKSKGYEHGHWLPPLFIQSTLIESDPQVKLGGNERFDIGFFGNLYAPNNVKGLLWFITEVLPLVRNVLPGCRMLVMGSNPLQAITDACRNNNISLIANPPHIDPYLERITVLINPVQFSSGVNIKTVDMLFRDHEVVSTAAGIKGLPDAIRDVFAIADTADSFSKCIIDTLNGKRSRATGQREELKKLFDGTIFNRFIPLMATKRLLN